jgi:predicted RNase H-like nuclease
MIVVGVDGCSGGWIAMRWDGTARELEPNFHPNFLHLLEAHGDAAAIGIDVPIGLPMGTARRCDLEARRMLGRPRMASVFLAPDARIIDAETYAEANARSRTLTGKGLSRQAFGIMSKIAEVNAVMTPELQKRVVEVHPEVSFWAMSGAAMQHTKKRSAGFDERREVIARAMGFRFPQRRELRKMILYAAPDDALDAVAAAWTALRVASATSAKLPLEPEVDARGLRMEIVY